MITDDSGSALLPAELAEFRERYRSAVIGRHYNGFVHLGFVVAGSLIVIGAALSFVRAPTWLDWLCIPVTFLAANVVEFLGHRGPMHRRFRWLGLIFHRHTHEHHRFFPDEWVTCRSQRDFKIVLFPPVMLLFYLGSVAFPIGLLLYFFHTQNTSCFYVATTTFYFMSYEVLHFTYHLDERLWIARLPVIRSTASRWPIPRPAIPRTPILRQRRWRLTHDGRRAAGVSPRMLPSAQSRPAPRSLQVKVFLGLGDELRVALAEVFETPLPGQCVRRQFLRVLRNILRAGDHVAYDRLPQLDVAR
jgi:hypothetical protein